MPIEVTHHRFRSSDELNQLPYAKIAAHRAVRTPIRKELNAGYEIPQEFAPRNDCSLDAPEPCRKLIARRAG
jgi:hypothetical protein